MPVGSERLACVGALSTGGLLAYMADWKELLEYGRHMQCHRVITFGGIER
jgi:hypothetical protein